LRSSSVQAARGVSSRFSKAMRGAVRSFRSRLSSLTVPTAKVVQPIGEDGLAVLPKTLPIHKGKGEALVPKEGASYIEVVVDGNPVQIESGSSILQAIESTGINVPRFCFHERLSVAGNCRMCLVEIEKSPKPVASCAMPTMPGMKIFTNSPMVKKAREGVMEFLLANHPLDCPICDQGGECDLQDQAMLYGSDRSRYVENKRAVEDKNLGPLVKTSMTRCIHCTRCVRFSQEVAGVNMLGTVGRGNAMEISTYVNAALDSEMSGNVVDLCPVGALTAKPNAFAARSWEYRTTHSIDVLDGCGPSIQIDTAKGEVMRVQPRTNDDVNEEWISDKTRFAVDGLKRQRLDMPLARNADGSLTPVSWKEALGVAAGALSGTRGTAMAALAGPLVEAEILVALKDLMNSLGCTGTRSTATSLSADLRASYTLNATIAGLEEADAVLLVGTNPRVEAPLLNARLRKLVRHHDLPVASVGKPADLTYEVEQLGESAAALSDLLAGKGAFAETLKGAKKPAVIVGLGALDVGFVPGPTAAEVSEASVVYLLGADEAAVDAIPPTAFVIYQGHHGDKGAARADLVLPGAAYTEKSGTYVNTEGRVQRTSRALDPPGDAREDWSILVALSKVLGKPLPYETIGGVRARLAEVAPQMKDASGDAIEASSAPLAALALEYVPPSAPSVTSAALGTSVANFYMTDAVSRASATMAKCVQAYGTRA